MESLFEYLSAFSSTIDKNYPDKDKRTIENYLETFASLPPWYEKSRKCVVMATVYREQGKFLMMIGSYAAAVSMYTQSLREAPPYSNVAAVAYAQRSINLYGLKAYEECISDIDKALDLPCPNDIRPKLYSLKESAVANLNNPSNQLINNTPIEDLKFPHGDNSKLPGVSDGIEIAYSPKDGRKLVAKMPFKTGDVLIVQNPYLPVIELDEDPAYCQYCFKKSLCLIPCEQCDYEVYCSEKCRTDAYENYHRIECKIQNTLRTAFPLNRQGLLFQLRCLNILTEQGNTLDAVYADLKEIEDNPDPAKLGFTGENFIGNTRKAFLSLLSGKEIKHNCAAMFEAAYLVTLLKNHTNFFKKNADILLVAKLLIKLSTIYSLNRLPIREFGKTDVKGHVTYPLLSLAKHACINNTISYIDKDGRYILRASQIIKPGDEILCSYRVHFSIVEIVSRSSRMLMCKRYCQQCDKTFSYPPEKPQRVKLDQKLRNKLRKNPYDIEGLWRLLNIIHGKHQRYNLQAQIVRSMLVNAYEGCSDHGDGNREFEILGIL